MKADIPGIYIDPAHGWQTCESGSIICHGRSPAPRFLPDLAAAPDLPGFLKTSTEFSGGIAHNRQTGEIRAWADHIRSFPVFYAMKDAVLHISNNARHIRDKASLTAIDDKSALELRMAGYATGPHTLYESLKTLQPGESLSWTPGDPAPKLHRWFRYIPAPRDGNREDNREKLGHILDALTQKMIVHADGRPIWIPLSAGLDSRIILCKLHEHGYKNIQTFTYGPRFNFESGHAKRIAATLDVPWQMVTPPRKWIYDLYHSDTRKNFWAYADGLRAVPCMREFSAVTWLKQNKIMPDDAMLINGQSGDYITGGHIPDAVFTNPDYGREHFYANIIDKHYDLWRSDKTAANLAIIRSRIDEIIDGAGEDFRTLLETWEYDARQICTVVNGQRIYEFHGHDWEMPLWERSLVDFYHDIPWDQKRGQSLYKDYLQNYNYKNLFPETEPYIWRWPAPMLWVLPAAKLIGLLGGDQAKTDFYALMRYHGHYANQYACFNWPRHRETCRDARNITSLFTQDWLNKNFP